jgi:hypothetical protein
MNGYCMMLLGNVSKGSSQDSFHITCNELFPSRMGKESVWSTSLIRRFFEISEVDFLTSNLLLKKTGAAESVQSSSQGDSVCVGMSLSQLHDISI